MNDPHRIHSFATDLGSALDDAIVDRPGITALEVCGVLGALAGVVVAGALPHATAEVDELHLDAMVGSYHTALLEMLTAARDVREARRIGMN